MKTFTPGPWTFVVNPSCNEWTIQAGDDSLFGDAEYYPWVSSNKADWHLIAAAPDLLEALQKALNALVPVSGDYYNPVYSVNELRDARTVVEAAIAKAVQA